MIGIDGLPLGKSSESQLWPILGSRLGSICGFKEIVVIGIYHSLFKKPESAFKFLNNLTDEVKDLIENGIVINNNNYQLSIKIICAGAPAKSFILGVIAYRASYRASWVPQLY